MTFRATAKMTGLTAALKAAEGQAAAGAMRAMRDAETSLKDDLRSETEAILGPKVAKAWQGTVYPKSAISLTPAAYVFTKSPGIIDAYARGVTIVAKAGRRLLALPTDNVPQKRTGNALTPKQVESRYGRKLKFVPAKGSGISGHAVAYLVLEGRIKSKVASKHRAASAKQLAGAGGAGSKVEALVMFTLVAAVKVPKKLDLPGSLNRAAAELPQLLAKEWGQ